MPFVSQAQRKWMYENKPKMAKEWSSKTPKGAKLPQRVAKKKKPVVTVNNKMKGSFGQTTIKNGKAVKVEINVKKHKGDKAELADTIKHELYHVKHPKAHEKTVRKAMPKTISPSEQARLIAKLRTNKINRTVGIIKKKLKMSKSDNPKPGELISRARAMSAERLAIMGLV